MTATKTPTSEAFTKKWQERIADALKREKNYRATGRECVELYEAKHYEKTPFAILYSNTETLAPAVYNAVPIPIVDRRFKDADPVGKAASEVGTRILKFLIEAESQDYDNFDELMQPAVLDGLVTDRGLTRYKYVAEIEGEEIKAECAYGEAIRWDKFFHGYARTWKKVPWIGFEWDMSKAEMLENFDEEIVNKINFESMEDAVGAEEGAHDDRQEMTGVNLAKIYEIWDKASRKVIFFCAGYGDSPLKVVGDPLKLASFFPVPKPMNFMRKITTLIPTPLYIQYKQQAKELNDLTVRLKKLIEAAKIRGFYNSTIEGIEKVLTSEENTLTPVENMESMPDGTGADKLIWLMPLADIVNAIQTLYQQREQVKQVIYEITGISDILRGASVASETATAQNIKNQWGTLRLKKMQKEVQRYCRDSLRILLEIAVTRFSQQTIMQMTGLNFPTAQMKQQAQMAIMQQQQQAQTQPSQPGQPPQAQQQPQIQEMLNTPTWEDILGVLKNDVVRSYKVDIETNSTLDAEASQDKQDISELLNALSQFLNGIAPLIEKGVLPFDVAKAMLLSIARRYTFGPQLEDALNKMTAPPPQNQPDPSEQVKLQVVQEQAKADMAKAQAEAQKTQMDMQAAQMDHQAKMDEMQLQRQISMEELAVKQAELQLQKAAISMKMEQASQQHSMKLEQMKQQAAKPKKETV